MTLIKFSNITTLYLTTH